MFYKNFLVNINNNKITSKQKYGTPGVYKTFSVKENTRYKINLIKYDKGNAFTILWIANINNRSLSTNIIKDHDDLYYDSKITGSIKIGVLFKNTKINKYFYLKNIKISEDESIANLSQEYFKLKDEILSKKIIIKEKTIKREIIQEKIIEEVINIKQNIINDENIIETKYNMIEKSISIIIPCYYKHFKHINNLLKLYDQQTLLPKEIIIVLSEYTKLDKNVISKMEDKIYNFDLKIIRIKEKSPAGRNRYLGSENAEGDIIIFQDADDLPHNQRNEIIDKCFINYPHIVHILHGFSRLKIDKKYDVNDIPIKILHHNIFCNHPEMASYNLTNGNIAIAKRIVDKIPWETKKFRGQDVALNRNIYSVFKEYLIIRLQLYVYRQQFTSKYAINLQ